MAVRSTRDIRDSSAAVLLDPNQQFPQVDDNIQRTYHLDDISEQLYVWVGGGINKDFGGQHAVISVLARNRRGIMIDRVASIHRSQTNNLDSVLIWTDVDEIAWGTSGPDVMDMGLQCGPGLSTGNNSKALGESGSVPASVLQGLNDVMRLSPNVNWSMNFFIPPGKRFFLSDVDNGIRNYGIMWRELDTAWAPGFP